MSAALRLPPDVPATKPDPAPTLPRTIDDDYTRRRFADWAYATLGVRIRWCWDRPASTRYVGPTLALVTGGPWRVSLVRDLLAETPGADGVEVVGEA